MTRHGKETLVLDRLGLWTQQEADMRLRDLSGETIKMRRHVLANLARAVDLADATPQDVRSYLAAAHLCANARATYLSHLRTFYAWCLDQGLLDSSPCAKITAPKITRGLPRPIAPLDLSRALTTAHPKVRVWLMLGAYAGLRCMEAASLRADCIVEGEWPVLVVTGKGGKTRTIPLHPVLEAELARWPSTGYLFPGYDGHPHVAAKHVSQAVNAHLHACGIAHTAHTARHRFATDYAQQTNDTLGLMRLLGHSSLSTTQVYAQPDTTAQHRLVRNLDYSKTG